MKKVWMAVSVLIIGLVAIGLTKVNPDRHNDNNTEESSIKQMEQKDLKFVEKTDEITDRPKKEKTDLVNLEVLNNLVANGQTTGEIYVTDDIIIGQDEEVKPGVYDMEILGGGGNIFGERASAPMYINWLAGTKGNENGYVSVLRVILFEGDKLELSKIGKVKFTAVPTEVESTLELGIGEFIVGRDVPAGKFKLGSNIELNKEFDNLGWHISTYDLESGESKEQNLTPGNSDVALNLKEGQVLSVSLDNTNYGSDGDKARLIFEEF